MIDETIPGPMEVAELRYLEKLASELPTGANMCEVGTFLGRSAYVFAATRGDCSLLIVDPFDAGVSEWLKGPTMRGNVALCRDGHSQLDMLRQFMDGCENYSVIRAYSPLTVRFPFKFDLVFIDAAHNYDSISADIAYWSRHVKTPQALCGHDYCAEFDDVRRAVNEYAARIGARVYVEPGTTVWKIA